MASKTKIDARRVIILWSQSQRLEVVEEFRFAPPRRWRFDFAWPRHLIACEIDGAVWTGGRHTSGVGFTRDCEKLSIAAAMGWRVIRATTGQVKTGEVLRWLEMAFSFEQPTEK